MENAEPTSDLVAAIPLLGGQAESSLLTSSQECTKELKSNRSVIAQTSHMHDAEDLGDQEVNFSEYEHFVQAKQDSVEPQEGLSEDLGPPATSLKSMGDHRPDSDCEVVLGAPSSSKQIKNNTSILRACVNGNSTDEELDSNLSHNVLGLVSGLTKSKGQHKEIIIPSIATLYLQ